MGTNVKISLTPQNADGSGRLMLSIKDGKKLLEIILEPSGILSLSHCDGETFMEDSLTYDGNYQIAEKLKKLIDDFTSGRSPTGRQVVYTDKPSPYGH